MSVKNLKKYIEKTMNSLFNHFNDTITTMNTSKIFAGVIILILNISSKFVTIKLGKTMESYLKFTFSKHILIFAMAWMGTRDIYVALIIAITFIIFFDYLFHDDSPFCCLPDSFKQYHIKLLDDSEVSEDEIKKAKEVLEKAEKRKENHPLNVENPLALENKPMSQQQRQNQVLY
uniref:Uncharacterized protein n=1 Tax=viral metagenome TaxID=1070528 RepID=A0A6C0B755_9ZZZZ